MAVACVHCKRAEDERARARVSNACELRAQRQRTLKRMGAVDGRCGVVVGRGSDFVAYRCMGEYVGMLFLVLGCLEFFRFGK